LFGHATEFMELLKSGSFRNEAGGLAFERFSQRVLVADFIRRENAHTSPGSAPCLNEPFALQTLKRFADR
jgi:hypothetical protein